MQHSSFPRRILPASTGRLRTPEGEPAMHSSPTGRATKVLTGLVVAAGLVFAAEPPGQAASTGEGATEKQLFSQKLPNVPGKTVTVVQVDYRPGGFSAPHRHPASGFEKPPGR